MPKWIREKFPLPSAATDAFPAPSVTQKHTRWVLCPLDQKFYIFGGDFGSAWQKLQSGQNSLLSYHPPTKTWAIEYPFWGKRGEHYPMHMDEVAVCWDSKRKLFWLTNGYQGGATPEDREKAIGIQTRGIVQTFDPLSKNWALPFGQLQMVGSHQHSRSVYDPDTDLIYGPYYDGGWGTAISIFNPNTGIELRKSIRGIGNYRPSTGQTVHLIDGKIYFTNGMSIAEYTVSTAAARILAFMPNPMYADQDNSYIPELDSFLIWDESPAAYLVNRVTGIVSPGPTSPLLSDGTGYRPQNNNRHPSGVIVIGWSAATTVQGRQVPEYWHYSLSNVERRSISSKQESSAVRATITTIAQNYPRSTKPAFYRFAISGPQNKFVDVPYGGALNVQFDDVSEGNYTITVELLDSAGTRLGNLVSKEVTIAEADIVLQGLFGLTPGIRIKRAPGRTSETSDD